MSVSTPCSRCGFQSTTTQLASEDEASLLTEEIRQIDEIVRRLNQRKATASMRLNAIRSRTSGLPDELLSAIFESVMEVYDTKSENPPGPRRVINATGSTEGQYFSLHVLGAVCSHWRRVAWSTQGLWLNLNLDVYMGILKKHGLASYFINAGSRLMTVTVDFRKAQQIATFFRPRDDPGRRNDKEILGILYDVVFLEYPQKIANLRIYWPPPDWLRFPAGSFTALKRIELYWSYGGSSLPGQRISLTGLCSLKEVVIQQLEIDIELPWEQITCVELSHTSFQVATRLLTSCPNLVKFCAHSLLQGSTFDLTSRLPVGKFTLPHLETFLWEWRATTSHTELLHLLRAPSLRHLYWREYEYDSLEEYNRHRHALGSFFAKLPVTRFQLHLCGFCCFTEDEAAHRLSTIFNNSLHLKQFDIDDYLELHHDIYEIHCDLISTIARVLHKVQQEGGQMLPEFRQLSLNARCHINSIHSKGLVMLMDERRASGMMSFRLEVPSWFRPERWNGADRERLRAMAEEGFKLEIFEGGKMVPWCS